MINNILKRVVEAERISESVELVRRAVDDQEFEARVDEAEADRLQEASLAKTEGTMFLSPNEGE